MVFSPPVSSRQKLWCRGARHVKNAIKEIDHPDTEKQGNKIRERGRLQSRSRPVERETYRPANRGKRRVETEKRRKKEKAFEKRPDNVLVTSILPGRPVKLRNDCHFQ